MVTDDDDDDVDNVLWCARLCVDSGGEFVLLFPGGHNLKKKLFKFNYCH